MTFKIESDIAIPEFIQKRNWPFKNMDIGQSFLLERPADDMEFSGDQASKLPTQARAAAASVTRSKGWKFRSAWEAGGLRFWRVS